MIRPLLALALASAAVGCLADPTDAYRLPPGSWVSVGNDSLLVAHDDYLTGTGALHLQQPTWTASSEYAVETDRADGRRTDQAALVAGPHRVWGGLAVDPSAGVILDGNLGGQAVQDAVHRTFGYHAVDLLYHPKLRGSPLVQVATSYTWYLLQGGAVADWHRHLFALAPSAAIGDETMRASVGWAFAWGRNLSLTAAAVDENMRGPTASLGFHLGLPAFSVTYAGHALLWSVGATW